LSCTVSWQDPGQYMISKNLMTWVP
jgi:hypothetical protein